MQPRLDALVNAVKAVAEEWNDQVEDVREAASNLNMEIGILASMQREIKPALSTLNSLMMVMDYDPRHWDSLPVSEVVKETAEWIAD